MHVVSERDLILNVVNQVEGWHGKQPKRRMLANRLDKLRQLDLTTATRDEVNKIWGHDIIQITCIECSSKHNKNKRLDDFKDLHVERAIKFPWGHYCLNCLVKGVDMVRDKAREEFIKEQTDG